MRTLVVDYYVSSGFKIPRNIPLLSVEDNNEVRDKTPWSWWVKYDTLHYYDNNKVEHTIDPDYRATDGDFKYPSHKEFDDEEEEEEEEDDEDDIHICKTCNEPMNNENFEKGKMCCDKPMFHNDEEEEEEEEEEWSEIYYSCPIQEFTDDTIFDTFKDKKNTFYQTYGGGPVGGWLVVADNGLKIYDVDKRGWGSDWTCKEVTNINITFRDEDRKNGVCKALKVGEE
jgi:hypothetical protein